MKIKYQLPFAAFLLALSMALMSQSTKTTAQSGLKASIDRGKKVYEAQCLSCHQADGQGVQNMIPTLVKTKWVLG